MTHAQRLEQSVQRFNAKYRVGSAVAYRAHPHSIALHTKTASEAWVLSDHTAVVMVENVRGCVAIDAITSPVSHKEQGS